MQPKLQLEVTFFQNTPMQYFERIIEQRLRITLPPVAAIAQGIAAGTQAIVGATYHLADGRVELRHHVGDIGQV